MVTLADIIQTYASMSAVLVHCGTVERLPSVQLSVWGVLSPRGVMLYLNLQPLVTAYFSKFL